MNENPNCHREERRLRRGDLITAFMRLLRRPYGLLAMTAFLFFIPAFSFAKPLDVGPMPPLVFQLPQPEKLTLSNGITVYLLEDHELPLFSMTLKMRTSPTDEPKNLRGLLGVMGNVWRVGGTDSLSPEALNEKLESMAANIETSAGEESANISLSCLTKDREQILQLFRDILLHPRFSEDQVSLVKQKLLESLRRKNDEPFDISRRAFRDITFGKSHVYAWSPTPTFVNQISRTALRDLHKKVTVPNQAILVISGDYNRDNLVAELDHVFSGWNPTSRVVADCDYSIKDAAPGKVFYVEKDYTQSVVYIGGLGISRHSPDQYAMALTNYILGEGGPSRLFLKIRTQMGLAYMVASFYRVPKGPGVAGVVSQTKAGSTLQVIKALRTELNLIRNENPTGEEVQEAKDAILNSFIFRFESPEKVVSEQADLDFYGFPADYFKTYPQKIENLSPADITAVAKKYFDYDQMKVLVIGNKNKFDKPLEELGPVTVIPLESIE